MFYVVKSVGCGTQKGNASSEQSNAVATAAPVYKISLHNKNVIETTERALTDVKIVKEDKYVQLNNMVQNESILPYKDGYVYYIPENNGMDGPNDVFVYDDGKGNIKKYREISYIISIIDDTIYYQNVRGKYKKMVGNKSYDLDLGYRESVFFDRDWIYYSESSEDDKKTCVYKVDYDGGKRHLVYEFDVCIEEMRMYKNKLWFAYYEFGNVDSTGLGVLDFEEKKISTYKNVFPDVAILPFLVNGDYIYYNQSGFKRLNIIDNTVEQIFAENVVGASFSNDGALWCAVDENKDSDSKIYKVSLEGITEIKVPLNNDEVFGDIDVYDDDEIFVWSCAGAFHHRLRQINAEGRVVKQFF